MQDSNGGKDEELEFQKIKDILAERRHLAPPLYDREFVIESDASRADIGAVLYQWGDKGRKRIIPYIFEDISSFERNLDIHELEGVAAIRALDKFHGFTQGCKIKLLTDNISISNLLKTSSPSEKQVRWRPST